MNAHHDRRRKRNERVLIAGFLLALFAPLVDMALRPSSARDTIRERRQPAAFPELSFRPGALWAFAGGFDAWWKDTFGLRDKLLFGHSFLKLMVFGVSPSPIVTFGRDHWLFYSGNDAIEVDLGLAPFRDEDLNAWVRMLGARRDWLAARGIQYLVAWVPSKSIVYPEKLPVGHAISGENRVDQLIRALGPSWKDDLLDLRPSQFAEKQHDRPELGDWTWYPLGTHWTERGACAGYFALMENLRKRFPSFVPRSPAAFATEPNAEEGDSWARRLYLERWLPQPMFTHHLQRTKRAHSLGTIAHVEHSERFENGDAQAPRMLMFHDSMAPPLKEWIAEPFSTSTFYWQFDFDLDKVLEAKPDIVIALFSDRSLSYVQPRLTAAEAGADVRASFAKAERVFFDVDCSKNEPAVAAQGDAELSIESGALVATLAETESTLLLPHFEPRADETPVLRVVVDSEVETKLDVFYRTEEDPVWQRKRGYQLEIAPGRNEVYVELLATGLLGDIRMRPGRQAGRYVLHSIELRSVRE
jgi:hypothetical protein